MYSSIPRYHEPTLQYTISIFTSSIYTVYSSIPRYHEPTLQHTISIFTSYLYRILSIPRYYKLTAVYNIYLTSQIFKYIRGEYSVRSERRWEDRVCLHFIVIYQYRAGTSFIVNNTLTKIVNKARAKSWAGQGLFSKFRLVTRKSVLKIDEYVLCILIFSSKST